MAIAMRTAQTTWEGPLAAGGQEVLLRKIGGKWHVVQRRLGPVA